MGLLDTYAERALLVEGVAGSGKSTLIASEAKDCIRVGKTLLVTYSKAGRDVLQRYMQKEGVFAERTANLQISTIDGLAMKILRKLGENRYPLGRGAVIHSVLPKVIERAAADLQWLDPYPNFAAQDLKHVLKDIEFYRASGASSADYDEEREAICGDNLHFDLAAIRILFRHYETLRESWQPPAQSDVLGMLDPDFSASDTQKRCGFRMVSEAVYDLLQQPEFFDAETTLSRFGFRYVLIDELHDTTPLQMRFLCGIAHKSARILAVGDRNQNIYAWRNTDTDTVFKQYQSYFQAARVDWLASHRFGTSLARMAGHVTGRSITSDARHRTVIHAYRDAPAEAVQKVAAADGLLETAVICRDQADKIGAGFQLVDALTSSGFALGLNLTDSFACRIVSFLHAAHSPRSSIPAAGLAAAAAAFLALPHCLLPTAGRREVEERAAGGGIRMYLDIHLSANVPLAAWRPDMMAALASWLALPADADLATALRAFQTRSALLSGASQGAVHAVAARHVVRSWAALIEYLAARKIRLSDWPRLHERLAKAYDRECCVDLLTVEEAKGREFGNVIVYGLSEGNFPERSEPLNIEINRFYVAITRARRSLTLLSSGEPGVFYRRYAPGGDKAS
ncbi:UvrD-helicase domain-containing protein [Paludibacterium yongneupense]|uniref:UvrD-helicase domain-containing protein n=1 Tax=Paludibacterium yongneupense TaxID=400061 RepID=UPI0003FB5295|nr:UvrD-helicase domain-containing protein [Paludibacterium yongneupense]